MVRDVEGKRSIDFVDVVFKWNWAIRMASIGRE